MIIMFKKSQCSKLTEDIHAAAATLAKAKSDYMLLLKSYKKLKKKHRRLKKRYKKLRKFLKDEWDPWTPIPK